MSEFLKGNFSTKRPVVEQQDKAPATVRDELRRVALSSLGGSMVFMERDELTWDGDLETKDETKQ